MKKVQKIKIKQKTSKKPTKKIFKFKSKVIVWKSRYDEGNDKGAWRFARVPEDISLKIKELQQKEIKKGRKRRGWGAVYAKAKVGKSEWTTSVFPDRHSATYILPLKKEIRFEENLYDGEEFHFSIGIWF